MSIAEAKARLQYRVAHWGHGGKDPRELPIVECADPSANGGVLTELGELVSVVYLTTKRGDPTLTEYEHKFLRARPRLAFTRFGAHSLVIVGGDYRMRVGGITG